MAKGVLAFNELAKNDRFGKEIRLRSGNVASRMLPIRIHDLEPEDVRLCLLSKEYFRR